MLLTVVADYGTGDLAFAEVRQRLALLLPDADVTAIPVPPFDTVSAGFCVAQLAFGAGPGDRVVYANVAPRQDEDRPRENNAGEQLVAARLPSGVLVVGVAAGASLSFVAQESVPLRTVQVTDAGSQFRSRDVFPGALAALAAGDDALLGPATTVDPAPVRSVVYTDGYGNLKTSWHAAPAPVGSRVRVRIGAAAIEAVASDGVFTVPAGTVSFAPGSSGWTRGDGSGRREFYELFARGGDEPARRVLITGRVAGSTCMPGFRWRLRCGIGRRGPLGQSVVRAIGTRAHPVAGTERRRGAAVDRVRPASHGVQPLRAAYGNIVSSLGVDAIVLVDGGTDVLLRAAGE